MSEHDWFQNEDYVNPREGVATCFAILLALGVMLVITVWAAREYDF